MRRIVRTTGAATLALVLGLQLSMSAAHAVDDVAVEETSVETETSTVQPPVEEAGTPEPEPTPELMPESVPEPTSEAKAAVAPSVEKAGTDCAPTYSVQIPQSTATLGGTLRVTGAGWCHPGGGGSVIGLKIDEGAYSRKDASVHANRTIWAVISAAADGTFDTEITLPDGTAGTSTPAMTPGTHTLRLLTGSLKDGDAPRTLLSGEFTTLPRDTSEDDPATWGIPLTAGKAKAWVQRDVSTADGTLRLAGEGWQTKDGKPSTLAIKLGSSPTAQFQRPSGVILDDRTIWALGSASPKAGSEFRIAADGSFDAEIELPAGLSRGKHLSVALTTGKFGQNDVQRSVFTSPLAVDGEAYVIPDEGADVKCRPTSDVPTVTVETAVVQLGGVAVVTGEGWCHPVGGASKIGVKIDDGGISRLDDDVHTNRTIWTVIQAKHSDGTFRAEIEMPDGTQKTSTPALRNGAHSLRFLSGSLRTGDAVRTLDAEIVVGRYRPSGTPDPVDTKELRRGTRKGVEATVTGKHLDVRVPKAKKGEWLFLTAYAEDGSPRYLWSKWLKADRTRSVRVKVPTDAPEGRFELVVQSGAQGKIGALRGWDDVVLRAAGTRTPAPPNSPVVVTPDPTPEDVEVAGLVTPEPPAKNFRALGDLPRRGVSATVDGAVTTLRLPHATPESPVFVTVYGPGRVLQAGWATVDSTRSIQVDLSALGEGEFAVAVQAEDGTLLGWAEAPSDEGDEPAGTSTVPPATRATDETPRVASVAAPLVGATDGWLLALGALVLAGVGVFVRTRKAA